MDFIDVAFREANKGVIKNHGGPFGAVIVKNNKIISKAHNTVLKNKDSTCHAEMNAIRKACRKLKNYDLSNCQLYTTFEPCPMCLSAILWARIPTIYYYYNRKHAAEIGFDDNNISEFFKNKSNLKLESISIFNKSKDDLNLIKVWKNKKNKIIY